MAQKPYWRLPATPWEVVLKRFMPQFDPATFAKKHNFELSELLAEIASGCFYTNEIISAAASETGVSEQFFRNLTKQYMDRVSITTETAA